MATPIAIEDTTQLTTDLTCDGSTQAIKAVLEHIREDSGIINSIQLVSCDPEVSKLQALRNVSDHDGNWLVHLHTSDDISSAHRVLEAAEAHANITNVGPSGISRGGVMYHVFAVVYRGVTYEEQYSNDPKNTISRNIVQYHYPPFYIGIASGPDAITAMKRRRIGDKYKECHGVNVMIAIYKSQDQEECRAKEAELIKYFRDTQGNLNRKGGGGGRRTTQPFSYVYLGMKVPNL